MFARLMVFSENTMFGGYLMTPAQFSEDLEEFLLKERQLS
jgi:hypothetical protein